MIAVLEYQVIRKIKNALLVRSVGTYDGKRVIGVSWVSKELLADEVALDSFLKLAIETWATKQYLLPIAFQPYPLYGNNVFKIFKSAKFSQDLKACVGNKPLRQIVRKELDGVTFSTLSRVMRGATPSIETFGLLCEWMHADPSDYFYFDNQAYANLQKVT